MRYESKVDLSKFSLEKGLNIRIRSARLDLELNKFDGSGLAYPTSSTYHQELTAKNCFAQLNQINSGAQVQSYNVIFIDLSNNMTNIMEIPNYFKQSLILNDRIIDEEVIQRLMLSNTIDQSEEILAKPRLISSVSKMYNDY